MSEHKSESGKGSDRGSLFLALCLGLLSILFSYIVIWPFMLAVVQHFTSEK